ncbi:hypothetical protein OG762_13170 [Streptomyces sp. NBC_01136]|uniref:hypothetical protein n=1 Tax=Streptomyces sp. NBC_01136 TaxID=2903754 RepID=UPI00386F693F|nr:hypothetical protein OG762_13170 [Streptomyces sp. NBC_01136]
MAKSPTLPPSGRSDRPAETTRSAERHPRTAVVRGRVGVDSFGAGFALFEGEVAAALTAASRIAGDAVGVGAGSALFEGEVAAPLTPVSGAPCSYAGSAEHPTTRPSSIPATSARPHTLPIWGN